MLLQKFVERQKVDRMREKLDRLSKLAPHSPLKIGEIVAEVKAKATAEEMPLWWEVRNEILKMKVGTSEVFSMQYWREIATAMDDIFVNPDKKKEFKVSFPKLSDGKKGIKITRERG